jgi:DNA-directed RNA polymerase II subunit RPB2
MSQEVNDENIFSLIDLLLKGDLYKINRDSFAQFIEEIIYKELKEGQNIFSEKYKNNKIYRHKFQFENIGLKPPINENNDELMFPEDARIKSLDYQSKLVADVKQILEIVDLETEEITRKVIAEEKETPVAKIPIMVKSKYCVTNLRKDLPNTECPYDPGCYFIIKGGEKVVLPHEHICENKALVFTKKDNTFKTGYVYQTQINSKSADILGMINVFIVQMKKDDSIVCLTNQFSEIPLFVLLRALGVSSDYDIIKYIVYDINDYDMANMLRYSLDKSLSEVKDIKGVNKIVRTQEDAIEYLATKLKSSKRYSETDEAIREQQKKMHVVKILENEFLPHMGKNLINKAIYVSYMCNNLLSCILKRSDFDDRDSYVNKRIDHVGVLLGQLFKQHYKKMLNDCAKFFNKKNVAEETPINVISQIKPNIIENGLKAGLATGSWGPKKKGVAQLLQRISYVQTNDYFRRFLTPSLESSNNKITSIRNADNYQIFFVCPNATPEGQKIGLVKGLSLSSNISLMLYSHISLIKDILKDELYSLQDVEPIKLKNYVKVFLNGEWLGVTEKPFAVKELLDKNKRNQGIHSSVGISFDINKMEIKIYCDGGRLYRPLLKVRDNKLVLTKKMLDDAKGMKSWEEFTTKYPDVIEYVDLESTDSLMIASEFNKLHDEKRKESIIVKDPNPYGNRLNRYNDTVYIKYTHSELHSVLMFGSIASLQPFAEHNYSTKNLVYFSHIRQSMGIYTSNYRYRSDISFVLYHPQRPIVTTKSVNYLNTVHMPYTENVVIAIASYSGFNQEDSMIINKTAVDRGLYRATGFKKYKVSLEKNPATSQDEIFMKPDPTKTTGMKDGNYDKLNEKGFVPEETLIRNGDVIIGKVSPIQPNANNKVFKDESEIYKSNSDGVIDKVWSGIYDNEGYEMYNMRVRSERVPGIGDKYASRYGQKATTGALLPAEDMPYTKSGMVPDLIINPCCLPTRQTVGQLIEMFSGKVGAIKGQYIDGTPFKKMDIEELNDTLKENGFEEYAEEEMYCGYTGLKMKTKIFIGVSAYARLKHLVKDKIHGRARGPAQILTRQPPEGRSRDGGLRFGEMECWSMTSHGASIFLRERMFNTSDQYQVHICNMCGLIASKIIDKDIYICTACRNNTDTSLIEIPYATKLLFQELMAINILPRIKVKENEYIDGV